MKRFTGIAVFFLLVLAASVALAEEPGVRPGAVTLTPFLGGYVFEGNQDLDEHRFTAGFGTGYNFDEHWAVEGAFNYIDARSEAGRGDVDGYIFRLDGLYHITNFHRLVPYVGAGVGIITLDYDKGGTDTDPIFNWGGGVKYFLFEFLSLRLDIRHMIPVNRMHNNLMYTFGVTYQFGGRAPAVAREPMQVDSDADGVADDLDKCPGTPAGVKVDMDGCPMDSDKDGVPDYLDNCPDTPKGTKVGKDGCPPDADHDGVPDSIDECPKTPAGVKVNEFGCPPDSDRDGVYDYLDECPETPLGALVDKKGCPVPVKEEICIILNVEFDFDKADVKPIYHEDLKKIADCLKYYQDTTAVLEAHTDSKGDEEYNMKLSQRRAESVRQYLIDKFGISAKRLIAKGFGESRPIADNSTEEGRQKNRRVEVRIRPANSQ